MAQSVSTRAIFAVPMARRYLVGSCLSWLGNGTVLGLFVIYLHDVRHLSYTQADLVLSLQAVFSLGFGFLAGHLIDRYGPKPIALFGIAITSGATVFFGHVGSFSSAGVAAVGLALGGALTWPSGTTMLARFVPESHRQQLFGLNFLFLNLGLGLGAMLGASVVSVKNPSSFELLYLVDGLSFLIFFAVVITVKVPVELDHRSAKEQAQQPGSYREIFQERRIRRLLLAFLLLFTASYGSLEAGFSAFIHGVGHQPVRAIGPIFAFNTFAVVVGQLFVLKRMQGKRRTLLMQLVASLWGGCWLLVALGPMVAKSLGFWLFVAGAVTFAIGETIWSPIVPSIMNAVAPAHLRGRYNALSTMLFGGAALLAPLIAGPVLDSSFAPVWPLLLLVLLATGAFLVRGVRRQLTDEEDGLSSS
jgi:MFS family permease